MWDEVGARSGHRQTEEQERTERGATSLSVREGLAWTLVGLTLLATFLLLLAQSQAVG